MAKPDAVFIYIGTYPSEAAARADYDVAKDLHAAGAVGTYGQPRQRRARHPLPRSAPGSTR